MNRILATNGDGKFYETQYCLPTLQDDEICVKSVLTGICRSDVDMMQGKFTQLPLHMQGHEGLGIVTAVGKNIKNVDVNNYVATRGEPAYADYYNVRDKEFVVVPSAEPKYILEPVACGINIINQALREIAERSGPGRRLLILGSGFLAWVAYNTILLNHLDYEITVIGKNNRDLWGEKLTSYYGGKFDVVVDLSDKTDVFDKDIMHNQGLIVFGNQKTVTTDFSQLLWKACTIVFPSPRTEKFYQCMKDAEYWITNGNLKVDSFWSKGYNRETEWEQAFRDSITRTNNMRRAYLYWN
jgi:D-arabinose 1-dehydrogenase-like Zn-dependent alcohol dehydrogenase